MATKLNPYLPSFSLLIRALTIISLACSHSSAATIPHGTVELISENHWITPGLPIQLGLHFELDKGWHIYWINPGDSGEPPRAVWHLPQGLSAGDMEWPTPKRLGSSTITDFGYEGMTTLLVLMRASASVETEKPVQIAADIKVLVCREICIPGKAHVSLSLPVQPGPPQPEARAHELFEAARKGLPRTTPNNWKFIVHNEGDFFILVAHLGREIRQAAFFPLVESQIENSAPQKLEPRSSGFELRLVKSQQLLKPISKLKGVLELSPNESYLIDASAEKRPPATEMR